MPRATWSRLPPPDPDSSATAGLRSLAVPLRTDDVLSSPVNGHTGIASATHSLRSGIREETRASECAPRRLSRQRSQSQRDLGSSVLIVSLITPSVLNWVILAASRWRTSTLIDSDGLSHEVYLNRDYNAENIIFCTSAAWCSSSVSAHIWLTLGETARRHYLSVDGQRNGLSFADRLEQSWKEVAELTRAELLHILMVSCDFFFAVCACRCPPPPCARETFLPASAFTTTCCCCNPLYCAQALWVGSAAFNGTVYVTCAAVLPGLGIFMAVKFVFARARATILMKQRHDTASFATRALKGTLMILMLHCFLLAVLVGRITNYPVDLLHGDCEFADNHFAVWNNSFEFAAPINSCNKGLFMSYHSSAAWVFSRYGKLRATFWATFALIYYFGFGSVLYYTVSAKIDIPRLWYICFCD
jgi:hypothetical protein